jgi:hypothetical protein
MMFVVTWDEVWLALMDGLARLEALYPLEPLTGQLVQPYLDLNPLTNRASTAQNRHLQGVAS